jgi:hypothetical protein
MYISVNTLHTGEEEEDDDDDDDDDDDKRVALQVILK